MKNLLVLTICIITAGTIELNGQSSKDILLENKWQNLLGNSLQFSNDSIVFDTTTFYVSSNAKRSIITDSSFLCLYNTNYRPHYVDHDTSFYFRYKVNRDSVVLNFLPSWSQWDEYANFRCSFPDLRFCYLVDKYLVFYSESYLLRTNKKFNFISLQTDTSYHIFYKLFADGSFIFSTKNTPFTSQNTLERRVNSVTFRTFNGVYTGKLKAETMDTLRTILEDFQGLKGYLHTAKPRLGKPSRFNTYVLVKGEHLTIPISDYPIGRNVLSNILHNPKEMSFMGLTGAQEPEPVVLVENPNIFPPREMWGGKFHKGLYALTGNVSNAETLSTKDTTLYLYRMTVDSFPMRIDETIKTGQSVPFVSPFQLSTEKIGVLYEKKTGYYRTFFGKVKQVKYNLITDTINFQHSLVYEYVGELERPTNRDMATKLMKDKNYPRINFKIKKAINAFNRRNKRKSN